MTLTRKELLAAADAAERYPPGWGESYVAGRAVRYPRDAARLLREDPGMMGRA